MVPCDAVDWLLAGNGHTLHYPRGTDAVIVLVKGEPIGWYVRDHAGNAMWQNGWRNLDKTCLSTSATFVLSYLQNLRHGGNPQQTVVV